MFARRSFLWRMTQPCASAPPAALVTERGALATHQHRVVLAL
jgi:hypothetical protein